MQGKNALYYNTKIDTQSADSLKQLISQIDAIISTLMTQAIPWVLQGNIAEYELDTGQTKTRIKYNSVTQIHQNIAAFRSLRAMYVNDLGNLKFGRVTQLVDQNNFRK